MQSSPFRLDGKTVLVTGGASGIGAAIAEVFAGAGAQIFVADIDAARADAFAATLPNGARGIRCDVTSEESVRNAFAGLQKLDCLVNNAGIGLVGGVEETEIGDFRRLYDVNVWALSW